MLWEFLRIKYENKNKSLYIKYIREIFLLIFKTKYLIKNKIKHVNHRN